MAVATYEDVAVALGRPITDGFEQQRAIYLLNAAELQIKARLGNVALLDQAALKYVETEAVAAKLQNPNGYQSETIDDYTYRFGAETRRVTITDDWWRLLRPEGASAAFSTRPGFVSDDPTVVPP